MQALPQSLVYLSLFGLSLTDLEIGKINTVRALQGDLKPIQPGESPGLVFFQYGKNKEGYWDGALFQLQVIEVINVLEILYPGMQILMEVDHSSGHLKEQNNGLQINAMGLRWGGKTTAKRDSIIEVGCLGANVPTVSGRKLEVGSTQRMIFVEGDSPPFLDPTVSPYDTPMSEAQVAREEVRRQKKKESAKEKSNEDDENNTTEPDAPFVIPGFIGKNKVILHIYQK